jgi:sulfite exporter TauE/SafE
VSETELLALTATAAWLGFFHTLVGPDHYVPFVAMARAGRWTWRRTMLVTALCGVGHVLSSVLLGGLGILLGWALGGMEALEAFRGRIAGWLLLGFGLAYLAWGIHRAVRRHAQGHVHLDATGAARVHAHAHAGDHSHADAFTPRPFRPWVLFTIFVFGPCEVLIPLVMVPASQHSAAGVLLVSGVFALATVGTMLVVVTAALLGLERMTPHGLGRWAHAASGFAVAACGALLLLGL